MDLVSFLRARYDEDEERARFVQREQGDHALPEIEPWRLSWHDEYDLLCIEPARVLAEVDAKRRMIARIQHHANLMGEDEIHGGLLRLLALPYASHPDYDEAWRP
jgi:hypothetical protein